MRGRVAIWLLVVVVGSGGAIGGAYWASPGFREALLVAGLVSGVEPLQYESAYRLQHYPTERAALALIAFVNLAYEPPVDRQPWRLLLTRPDEVSEPRLLELLSALRAWKCVDEIDGRDALLRSIERAPEALEACVFARLDADDVERKRARELARRALYSVCVLTGEAFGTDFDPARNGYGTLSSDEWSASLSELNLWTARTFGEAILGDRLAERGEWSS